MKKIILCAVSLLVFSGVSFASKKAKQTEEDSGLKVAYVSVNEAVEKTGEQDKIRRALEKERNRIQTLIRQKSGMFNKEAVKIRKEMALLSDEEKVKKYESIQKMQLTMEQFVKEKEVEFQKKEADLRSSVINRIKVAVRSVAKREKVEVIRNKDGVLWIDPRLDLTGKVVTVYNKMYK